MAIIDFAGDLLPRSPSVGVVVTVVGLIVVVGRHVARQLVATKSGHAPIVKSWLPLGLDAAINVLLALFSDRFLDLTRDLFREHGQTFELHMLGERMIFTSDVENIRAILVDQFSDFSKGECFHNLWQNILGDSVFNLEGDAWIKRRVFLKQHLSKIRSTDTDVFETHFQNALQILDKRKESVDVYDVFDRWGLDVVSEIFYGRSMHSLATEVQPFREAINKILTWNTWKTAFGPLGTCVPDWFIREPLDLISKQMMAEVDRSGSFNVQALSKISPERLTLLESLAVNGQDRKTAAEDLISVLIAGKDPIGVTMTWTMWLLAQHPDVTEKLRAEIAECIGFDRVPTKADVQDMSYVKNTVREILRLFPPLAMNVRFADTDTVLPHGALGDKNSPINIGKGTQIVLSMQAMQRQLELVPGDGNDFKPERWDKLDPHTYSWMPFNAGPRMCLANAFGEFILQWGLVRVLQSFSLVEPAEDLAKFVNIRTRIKLNAEAAGPVLCRFTKV